jgi:tRNA(Ile)-lysidine synthase
VALLRLMLELRGELGSALSVIHLNHQLRGAESDDDEEFVRQLAHRHQLQFLAESTNAKTYALEEGLSLEAAARHVRYKYFHRLVRQGVVSGVATAHTLDDQAETVLLRAVRGAGTAGLAGIYPRLAVHKSEGSIIRPLLAIRRREIERYLSQLQQPWREDHSNRDLRHTRNRVRHGIIPRLERHLNPSVRESLADMAEIARVEEEYWSNQVAKALPEVLGDSCAIRLKPFAALGPALQGRVLRAMAQTLGLRLEFGHVEDILEVCRDHRTSAAALPHGWLVTRSAKDELRFARKEEQLEDYQGVLSVPGETNIAALDTRFEALLLADPAGYPPEHLFDEALLNKELLVRNWRAGDRFWPAHTKAPKKIKELLQDRHVTGAERKLWPIVAHGQDVLWMRGFPRPLAWQSRPGATRAVLIREIALHGGPEQPKSNYDADGES